MRIKKLHLNRYGKFTDFTLDFGDKQNGESDFHIIYGLNEAGKSTTFNAWLDFLFGMGKTNSYSFLHDYSTMNIGASIEIANHILTMQRRKADKNSLLDACGNPINELSLSTHIAGLTRDSYKAMFSLDDDSLKKGGEDILNSKGDLGEILFSATAGLDGISEKLDKIAKIADGLYRKSAPTTKIQQLKKQLIELQQESNNLDVAASFYKKLNKEKHSAEADYHQKSKIVSDQTTAIDHLNQKLELDKKLKIYNQLQIELAEYKDFPMPPSHWRNEMAQLLQDDSRLKQIEKNQSLQIKNLQEKFSQNTYDPQLLKLMETIEFLADKPKSRFTTAKDDIDKRKQELQQIKAEINLKIKQFNQSQQTAHELLIDKNRLNALKNLLKQKISLDTKLKTAKDELHFAQSTLKNLKIDENTPSTAIVDDETIQFVETKITKLHDEGLINTQQSLTKTSNDLEIKSKQTFTKLYPFRGNFNDLSQLIIPNKEYWLETQQNYQRLHDQYNNLSAENKQHKDNITQIETKIATLNQQNILIDTQILQQLAEQRMQAWHNHYAHLNQETAQQFFLSMQKYDNAIDNRLKHFERIAQLEQAQIDIKAEHKLQQNLKEALDSKEDEIKKIDDFVQQNLQKIGIMEKMPTLAGIKWIQDWLVHKQDYINQYEELKRLKHELKDIETRLENIQNKLIKKIKYLDQSIDIKDFISSTKKFIQSQKLLKQQSYDNERNVKKAHDDVKQREQGLKTIKADILQWQQDWQSAINDLWLAHIDMKIIDQIIEKLEQLPELLQKYDQHEHRITTMQHDIDDFYNQIIALYDHAQLDSSKITIDNALIYFNDLQNKVIEAKQKADTIEQNKNELDKLEQEYQNTLQQLASHNHKKDNYFKHFEHTNFAVHDLNDLANRLDLAKELFDKQKELKNHVYEIKTDYGCDDIGTALQNINKDETQNNLYHLNELKQALNIAYEEKQQTYAFLVEKRKQLNNIGGDDKVAMIESKKQTIKLEIEDLACEFLKLKSGWIFAQQALVKYRDNHRSSMLERASQAFKNITLGHYNGLTTQLDGSTETLIAQIKNGGTKLSSNLSKGTQFQLYLSLRFAAYEEFSQNFEPIPFIADDIMETFDEPRSVQALHLMDKISQKGQVIYLTHHSHICELAKKHISNVKIHTLS